MSEKPDKSTPKPQKPAPKPGTTKPGLKPKISGTTLKASSVAIPKATISETSPKPPKSDITPEENKLPRVTSVTQKSPAKSNVSPRKNPTGTKPMLQTKAAPRLAGSASKASSIPKAATTTASNPGQRISGTQPSKLPRVPLKKVTPKKVTPKKEVEIEETKDSPTKTSPKVFISDPTGKVVGVLDSDSDPDVVISPPKSPKKTLLKPPDLIQVDSGLSGSGSDDGSPLHFANLFGETRAWFGPKVETPGLIERPATGVGSQFTGEDLPHHTDIIHGTWSMVYRWPPVKELLARPREITFAPASKMESVLFTCTCKDFNLDYMAPVKVIPEDAHTHVYSCQMVNREDDVQAALLIDSCGCRAYPLTKKFVVLPINEHYILHYEIVMGEEYSQANPNTVHLLYRGMPSTLELDYMLRGLLVAKRRGSATFMAKYQELL